MQNDSEDSTRSTPSLLQAKMYAYNTDIIMLAKFDTGKEKLTPNIPAIPVNTNRKVKKINASFIQAELKSLRRMSQVSQALRQQVRNFDTRVLKRLLTQLEA